MKKLQITCVEQAADKVVVTVDERSKFIHLGGDVEEALRLAIHANSGFNGFTNVSGYPFSKSTVAKFGIDEKGGIQPLGVTITKDSGDTFSISAVAILASGTPAAIFGENITCSLNGVYLKDGEIHISNYSVAGAIHGEDIDSYNQKCQFNSDRIMRVIRTQDEAVEILSQLS